jgi:hypothetical protein
MQFLYPNVLWGLLALSIPLIVHLFNFRRTKKIYFSNVALLKSVETKSSAFRKLKRWLIMASRMLAILFLVLAFAQPILRKGKISETTNQGINGIYLDNSMSMQNTTDGKRYLDLAIIKIDELLSLFNKSSNVQLITNDFDGQDQFVLSAGKIKDRLTTLSFAQNSRTYSQIYNRQSNIAKKYNPSAIHHLFWFSDFQKSTAGDIQKIKLDSNDRLHLIPILGKPSQNVFVDSVWLELPLVREMQNNVLNVKVYNSGTKAVDKLPLKLYIDGVQASTSSVNISPNSSSTANFNFTVKDRGVHKAKIIFDDQPITFDNEYFFVLNASTTIQVMHIYNQLSPQNYISKMYSNDSLFKYSSFNLNNFDPSQIKNADLVVLEGISTIENELKANLEIFISSGGSVVISPSENPNISSLQNFLGQYGIQNLTVLNELPDASNQIEINEPEKNAPFYADVFESNTFNSVVSLPKTQNKIRWSGVADKILSVKNGQNFLSKTKVGEGNIYLLASPLLPKYGNFAEHAYFVPTFYKMAYLSSKADKIAYTFGESTLSFFMPDAPKNANYKLKNEKLEIIPVQRLQGKTLLLELPKLSQISDDQLFNAGYYDLVVDGKIKKTIALNHEKRESNMEFYTANDLKEIFNEIPNITVYDDLADGDFVNAFRDTTLDKALWKYFIIAALLFLLVEIALIKFLKE